MCVCLRVHMCVGMRMWCQHCMRIQPDFRLITVHIYGSRRRKFHAFRGIRTRDSSVGLGETNTLLALMRIYRE